MIEREQIHFVTGRLAESSLRALLEKLSVEANFAYTLQVLPITVAALMTPAWIARRLVVPPQTSRVILPGYCSGDLAPIESAASVPVVRGPKDLHELPHFFGHPRRTEYGAYDIEILAEINHASRWLPQDLLAEALRLKQAGADWIDLGCTPGHLWLEIGDAVSRLRDAGLRISVDSFNPREIAPAVQAGAELVLSVNATNRQAALDWGCEVVVVPDVPGSLEGLENTIDLLATAGVPLRVDPIIEPIGFGFWTSLQRYAEVRRRWPEAEMLMGIGNLTELTEVDSAGVNLLLLAICQELGIRSVLTTQVINWARTSVTECAIARQLVHYAVRQRALPKHIDGGLVCLRDSRLLPRGPQELEALAAQIRDPNFRTFADGDLLHVVGAGLNLSGDDPFVLWQQLQQQAPRPIDADHAFYLGYELCKALTAVTLGKQYRQDEALDWGYLTRAEISHRQRLATIEASEPPHSNTAATGASPGGSVVPENSRSTTSNKPPTPAEE